jgi:hypothetical protein
MVDTAITADAEVRRLRRLGEAKHDWCAACPPAGPPPRDPGAARGRRALGAALLRAVSRRSATGSLALPTDR